MKICYLSNSISYTLGGGMIVRKVIDKVKKDNPGWQVKAFVTQKSGDFKEEFPLICSNKYKLLLNLSKIRQLIKNCDLIHAFDVFPYGIIAALCNIGLRKKLFITGIGTGAIRVLYHPTYSYFAKWAYRKADRVFAISSYTAREINNIIPELKIKIINPGVDFDDFCQRERDIPNEIKDKKPYILSVGAFKKRKGYHISLPAFARVLREFPHLNYIIVGDPKKGTDYFVRLKKIMKDLGIENRVFIFSNIDKKLLRQLYNNAELFCLMSQDIEKDVEGFGLVFLEAAASGLPVIGSKDTGAEDAILDMENGFLIKQNNVETVVELLLKILTDRDLKNRLGQNSINFAKKSNWDSMTIKYIEIYKIILNK